MMAQTPIETQNSVEVRCAFCRGSGRDPFGIMSWLSACCVCLGKGHVTVQTPYDHCAHCDGTGAVNTLTCTVCRGKGVLPAIDGPTELCPKCKGTGDDRSAPAMDCLKCRGRGRIPAETANKNPDPADKRKGVKG